jgi:predicted MFS family arabinose efflux permease
VCLVHTLVGIPDTGWTTATTLGLAGAAAAGVAFVRHGRRAANPLVPPSVLRSAAVTSALGILMAASASMFGTLFVGTWFLQDVLSLDPLRSGLRALPLAAMMVLGAPAAAVLLRRHGPRRTAMAGMALLALGVLAFSRLDRASTAVTMGGCFLAMGAGFVTVMVTATAVIVREASENHAGVAGGLQQTAMNIGPALGVAAATMLMPRGAAFVPAMGPALAVLAAVAASGALLAARLPGAGAGPRPGSVTATAQRRTASSASSATCSERQDST